MFQLPFPWWFTGQKSNTGLYCADKIIAENYILSAGFASMEWVSIEIHTFLNSSWYFFHWFWSSHNSLNNSTVKVLAIPLTNEFRKHLNPSSIWGWPFKLIYHLWSVIISHQSSTDKGMDPPMTIESHKVSLPLEHQHYSNQCQMKGMPCYMHRPDSHWDKFKVVILYMKCWTTFDWRTS